ncbi:MAG TPA: ComEA family DNA-binding protein [Thermomicrobiales bacterium]
MRGTAVVAIIAALVAAAAGALAVMLIDSRSAPPIVISDPAQDGPIVVSVEGAVARPGVYSLPGGSRVNDAIQASGGLTDDADVSGINLAARLRDEERLIVPSRAQPTVTTPEQSATLEATGTATAESARLININTASAAELEELPGIGPALARAIIDYRTANGPFRTIEELALVRGISLQMVDRLRPYVTV